MNYRRVKIFGGKEILIRSLSEGDIKNAKKFQDFINSVIKEDAKIFTSKRITLKEEKKWLLDTMKDIKKHKSIRLVAECKNFIVGNTGINLKTARSSHMGDFGIIIRNGYRGIGLGEYLSREVIKLAKKELKPPPKILRLDVFITNKPAINLYRKLGFKRIARIPDSLQYKGKLVDEYIMFKYLSKK